MNADIKVALDAVHKLVNTAIGNADTEGKVNVFLSQELQDVFFKMYRETYREVAKEKNPMMALLEFAGVDVSLMMVSAFSQGLTTGYFIGTQKQPETYADSLVHEYCQARGVDFAEVVNSMESTND